MNHSEIRKFVLLSLFSTVQIWGFRVNLKKSFWLKFFPLDPESGGQNLADQTDQML